MADDGQPKSATAVAEPEESGQPKAKRGRAKKSVKKRTLRATPAGLSWSSGPRRLSQRLPRQMPSHTASHS